MSYPGGMSLVVQTVFAQNMRLDSTFVRALKSIATKQQRWNLKYGNLDALQREHVGDTLSQIKRWRMACRKRLDEQIQQARVFGNKLVKTIVDCAALPPAIEVNAPTTNTRRSMGSGLKCHGRTTYASFVAEQYHYAKRTCGLNDVPLKLWTREQRRRCLVVMRRRILRFKANKWDQSFMEYWPMLCKGLLDARGR
ncbi:hypothetical protein LTR66_008423 [Elasticomyces elasticus]|nr:hypothetical protein LTR66_008423 [Elasticomyces elasticus]